MSKITDKEIVELMISKLPNKEAIFNPTYFEACQIRLYKDISNSLAEGRETEAVEDAIKQLPFDNRDELIRHLLTNPNNKESK